MPVIDEAFLPFHEIVERMLSFGGKVNDPNVGIRSHIFLCEIELPVELDFVRDERGSLHIGSTPPLYYVNTSFRPSYHRMRLTAEVSEDSYGD